MKKILFNDTYGLTKAVLEGKKTMTRRLTPIYKVGDVVAILHDISDEDCMKEGIGYIGGYSDSYFFGYGVGALRLGNSPREAFAALIDKVSGKGTWESNPIVFAYEFELLR